MADWDWSSTSARESLVLPRVDALAIYANSSGEIVLRQQGMDGNEDSIIIIPKTQAQHVVTAISEMLADKPN
ncbi:MULTISPECIES: hypothetical protein [unclassified Duganella]|jgi:hypothetical protein|uniref:hypothetical protein n=1 Tax=unclassified Duganella TaxID=2636909 RepID=UPI00089070C1|nr:MULTISPECIES: hypothetical protein [unclassified Duganella]SDF42360.1 hypothetical protein SAMN05216320_101148 [Duganella sp. OV458]SDI84194.1 hypothetical protein SAMN05428973_1011275 [Duganella sp. OV510]